MLQEVPGRGGEPPVKWTNVAAEPVCPHDHLERKGTRWVCQECGEEFLIFRSPSYYDH